MKYVTLSKTESKLVLNRLGCSSVTNSKSITYKRELGNLAGMTGEAIFKHLFPSAKPTPDNRDHDFILNDRRIDVKSRFSNLEPRPHWDCKIPQYSVDVQKCDIYVFMIVPDDASSGYCLGWMSKQEFRNRATLINSKDLLNGYVKDRIVEADLMVVHIDQLHPIEELEAYTKASPNVNTISNTVA